MTTHIPFYSPEEPEHPGDAIDCDECRVWLLDAFRTQPLTPRVPKAVGAPNGCPFCDISSDPDLRAHVQIHHTEQYALWEAAQAARPVDQVTPEYWVSGDSVSRWNRWFEGGQVSAAAPYRPPVAHATTSGAQLSEEDSQGTWAAFCTCGWRVHGHFEPVAGAAMALLRAVNHAAGAAQRHKDDPGRTDFEGTCG